MSSHRLWGQQLLGTLPKAKVSTYARDMDMWSMRRYFAGTYVMFQLAGCLRSP